MKMEHDEALLSNLTVPELQQECKKRGLKKSGIKIKLIQRLGEHIQKYGPNNAVPAAPPPPEKVVEKKVHKIHNPHPYMAEYEEQLIETANMEAESENTTKHDSASASTEPGHFRSKRDVSEERDESTSSRKTYPTRRSSEKDTAKEHDNELDARDMAEELTEPIHKSPVYPHEYNDRIVQVEGDTEEEKSNNEVVDMLDEKTDFTSDEVDENVNVDKEAYSSTDREEMDVQEDVREEAEGEVQEDEQNNFRDDIQEDAGEDADGVAEDVVAEALHTEEVNEPLDYSDTEDNGHADYNEEGSAMEVTNDEKVVEEPMENTEEEEEDRLSEIHNTEEERRSEAHHTSEEGFNGVQDTQEERSEKMQDTEKRLGSTSGRDWGSEQTVEEQSQDTWDTWDGTRDDEEGTWEERRTGDEENSSQDAMGEEKEEKENVAEGGGEAITREDSKEGEEEDGDEADDRRKTCKNEEEEEQNESGEIEEDGEITINDGRQNEFEENEGEGGGDDHLDVMVHAQDEKIDSETEEIGEIGEIEEIEEVAGTPKPVKKPVVPVSLKKRVSLIASTESAEERAAKRKRRWGSSSSTLKESTVPISSESIKKLIPNLKLDASVLESVPELDYQEEDTPLDTDTVEPKQSDDVELLAEAPPPKVNKMGRRVKVDSAKKITLNKPATTQDVVAVESDSGEQQASTSKAAAAPTATQSVRSFMVEEEVEVEEQREKSPSPARNPSGLYIYLDNLVRPYTINQLKSVIRRTGVIQEGGFWINNIKSHCYVKLSTEEESGCTRQALHGLRWPAGSPKLLKVDFAINEKMFAETEGLLGEKPKIVIEIEDKENDPVIITNDCDTQKERPNGDRTKVRQERKRRLSNKETVEKEKEKVEKKVEEREESPAKLLDDLFRKTKATPCIYWLPLTEEQILEKEKKETQNEINERMQRDQFTNDRNQDRRYQQYRNNNRSWR